MWMRELFSYSFIAPVLCGLVFYCSCKNNSDPSIIAEEDACLSTTMVFGAVTRGDSMCRQIALVFTADSFGDGGDLILNSLEENDIRASFFLTGNFYRNRKFRQLIMRMKSMNHYLGAHSDKHLLYCTWEDRANLLVTRDSFISDLLDNYTEMSSFGIGKIDAPYFLPPFEWYNDSINSWTKTLGFKLINYTPGTLSHTDYTTPRMRAYRSSEDIYESIVDYEMNKPAGLNGFILLLHLGTSPERTDKFYYRLGDLISYLKGRGYGFKRIDELL
jgi:peptidoglycan/xylan/chitin deacetylase (PgdA/CDA1 family)